MMHYVALSEYMSLMLGIFFLHFLLIPRNNLIWLSCYVDYQTRV